MTHRMPASMQDPKSDEIKCKCWRHTPTRLRCAHCEKIICPYCLVETPAGFICKSCASPLSKPLFQIHPAVMARGLLAGLILAGFAGFILVKFLYRDDIFAIVFSVLYGTTVAHMELRLLDRKRGIRAEIITGSVAFFGIMLGALLRSRNLSTFKDPVIYIMLVSATFMAVSRIRNL